MDLDSELNHLQASQRIEEALALIDEVTEELIPSDAFIGANARETRRVLLRMHWYVGERLKEEK